MDTADCFTTNYAYKAPAFLFANAGYDVWLGNTRGNDYSHCHEWLDPEKDAKKYYNYSF